MLNNVWRNFEKWCQATIQEYGGHKEHLQHYI